MADPFSSFFDNFGQSVNTIMAQFQATAQGFLDVQARTVQSLSDTFQKGQQMMISSLNNTMESFTSTALAPVMRVGDAFGWQGEDTNPKAPLKEIEHYKPMSANRRDFYDETGLQTKGMSPPKPKGSPKSTYFF